MIIPCGFGSDTVDDAVDASSSTTAEAALDSRSRRGLLAEMGYRQDKPTILYCDNSGAVELSRDLKSCQRSRHIERRYLKVRELVAAGEVVVEHISTKDNPADLFTKSTLDVSTFSRHAKTVKNE